MRKFGSLRSLVEVLSISEFIELDKRLRVIFSENRESEDSHENSIFLLFRQNIPFSELIQGKIV